METAEAPTCKHEYVRIYQRKLKGLERRLVSTRAYLPVGFKQADFGHLSEGSYCFCTKCRARLYPKRTAADKAQTRLANHAKLAAAESLLNIDGDLEAADTSVDDFVEGLLAEDANSEESSKSSSASIAVDELEIIPTELEELSEATAEIEESDEEDEL